MLTRLTLVKAAWTKWFHASQIPLRKVVILVVLILANLSILAYVVFNKVASSSSQAMRESGGEIKSLPAIEITDDLGTKRVLTDLLGKVVMIQFVNPESLNQVDGISKLLSSFTTDELSLVLVTPEAHVLRIQLPRLSRNTLVVEKDYAELKNRFHVPDCCEKRLIFSNEGKLKYDDFYYEADLTARLNALVKRDLPPWSGAVLKSLDSLKSPEFVSLVEQSKQSPAKPAVVLVFTSIATACASGELVKTINDYMLKGSPVSFFAILPSDYSDTDLENLKTNLLVRFPLGRANREFSEEFSKLVSSYGESRVNNCLLLINNGKVEILNSVEDLDRKLSKT